jgi:hypothetical protein
MTIPSYAQVSVSSLSPERRGLVALMQRLNFGRVESLRVTNGEPVLQPPPRVIREVKFGGENGPRPELASRDFVLKAQLVELFRQLDTLGHGQIESLSVKHGLPFSMNVEAGT